MIECDQGVRSAAIIKPNCVYSLTDRENCGMKEEFTL